MSVRGAIFLGVGSTGQAGHDPGEEGFGNGRLVGIASWLGYIAAIVLVLLAVFAVFIVATISSVDWGLLSFSKDPPVSDILASVALTFLAFLGFSMITFAAGDVQAGPIPVPAPR